MSRVVVVYESMYGYTHEVADAVAAGLGLLGDVALGSVGDLRAGSVGDAGLLVVGGPTHVHGMSRTSSRRAAVEAASKDEGIDLEPEAGGSGLREWFRDLPRANDAYAAAFDTRIDKAVVLTGSAAKGIAKQLGRHRYEAIADPESFFVETSEGPLRAGEVERAREWGRHLAERFAALEPTT